MSSTSPRRVPCIPPWLAVVLLAGCGDEILCQDPVILIQSPLGTVASDGDPIAPGVQVDVRVRTTFEPGTALALVARDAAGAEVAAAATTADAVGDGVFAGVTLPTGSVTLEVSASTACGPIGDATTVDVVAGLGCVVTLAQVPQANAFYDPLPVLDASQDPDPTTLDFDLGLAVTTAPGWEVEMLRTVGGAETSFATTTANDAGSAGFVLALDQGELGLRAECRGPGGTAASSLAIRFVVDTVAPTCALASPVPGSTITPSFDMDGDLGNGVQLLLDGAIGGGDVAGEAATFTITVAGSAPVDVPGTVIAGDGHTRASGTVAPATTPSDATLAVRAVDHAGNPCSASGDYPIVYDGCDIAVVAPVGPVSADADGDPANGAQLDVTLQVATECVGRPVDSDCGLDPPSGTVPPGGTMTLRVDMCATTPCEVTESCGFVVTTTSGVETQANVNLVFDAIGPDVTVAVVGPALACGAQVTPAVDQDTVTPGVQVIARVSAANAVGHRVQVTNATGTTTTPAPTDAAITLAPGANQLRGLADDAAGNVGTSPACAVTLADLAVSFAPPAADGVVNRHDGTVAGSSLTLPLCGSVSTTGASVTVAVDGGAAQPATVTGTGWCRTITIAESPPIHTIVATATKATSFGQATLLLEADLTPPAAITDLAAIDLDRQRIRMTWTAPADAGQAADGYIVKVATAQVTAQNFDSIGTVIPSGAPLAPGQPETLDHFPARTGTPVWLAVAARDENGNHADPDVVGPITPVFDQTGALAPGVATPGAQAIGTAIVGGLFNDDAYADVAVGAPGENVGGLGNAGVVSVYFGGPGGIAATPDLVIRGTVTGARVGSGLAAVRWTQALRDDLAIGAPGAGGGNGAIYVFSGGAGFTPGMATTADADRTIGVAAAPGWFAGAGLGFALAAGHADDDAVIDLVASAPLGGAARGGFVILYGDTITATTIGLSTVDPGAASGAVATLIEDPAATSNRGFGTHLHVVGPTGGATDATDDIVVAYRDDTTVGDWLYVFRPDGSQPTGAGVTFDTFTVGQDVRIDLVDTNPITELGSQAATIADQNGDGARELVITAYRASLGGQVFVIDGTTVGTGGVAQTTSPGVTLTRITGSPNAVRLGAALARYTPGEADVDGDGLDDLIVAGVASTLGRVYVWFGGEIPVGSATAGSAHYVITAPDDFRFISHLTFDGPAGVACWLGDVDGDGLPDAAYSSPNTNTRDGAFEVLFD